MIVAKESSTCSIATVTFVVDTALNNNPKSPTSYEQLQYLQLQVDIEAVDETTRYNFSNMTMK